ncbi:MAG TPA: ribosome silencing factor [Haloplasmataceae bacterium]
MNLLKVVTKACDDLKAVDIKILDMRGISPLVDYMVICTGRSERQVNAIVEKVREEVEKNHFQVRHIEGQRAGLWVLVDCNDVICHVFQNDERIKYSIERIWGEVPRIPIEEVLE